MFNKYFNLLSAFLLVFMLLIAFPLVILASPGHSDEESTKQEEAVQTDSHADGVEDTHSEETDTHVEEGVGTNAEKADVHTEEVEDVHTEEAENVHADEVDDHQEEVAVDIAKTFDRFLVVGGEAFVEALLNFILAVLWLLVVALQLARPYILQLVQKFGLRLGADLWWLSYVLIRDMVVVITFIMSLFFFYPMLLEERPFPIFGGVAAVFLFSSLIVRLVKDPDDDPKAYILETNLIGAGSVLYLISVIFGVQAAKVEALQPISKYLVSQSNTALAFPLLWLSLIAFVLLSSYAVWFVLRKGSTNE